MTHATGPPAHTCTSGTRCGDRAGGRAAGAPDAVRVSRSPSGRAPGPPGPQVWAPVSAFDGQDWEEPMVGLQGTDGRERSEDRKPPGRPHACEPRASRALDPHPELGCSLRTADREPGRALGCCSRPTGAAACRQDPGCPLWARRGALWGWILASRDVPAASPRGRGSKRPMCRRGRGDLPSWGWPKPQGSCLRHPHPLVALP